MAQQTSRDQQIRDLRLLLDWLENHPAVPLPDLNLAAVLHMTPTSADAVITRAASTTGMRTAKTPVGGKVLRHAFGSASYRLVVLPPPYPALEPSHTVTPYEPRRTARIRKTKQRPSRSRTGERPNT